MGVWNPVSSAKCDGHGFQAVIVSLLQLVNDGDDLMGRHWELVSCW